MEQTLVIIKPDGVQRQLVGEIITRFEKRGLRIVAAKFMRMDEDLAYKLYVVHRSEPYFQNLIDFTISDNVFVLVLEAEGVVGIVRQMVGTTFGINATPGTIRGDYCCTRSNRNIIHASDQVKSAEEEIALFLVGGIN